MKTTKNYDMCKWITFALIGLLLTILTVACVQSPSQETLNYIYSESDTVLAERSELKYIVYRQYISEVCMHTWIKYSL